MHRPLLPILLSALTLTTGCATDLNNRLELGPNQRTPTFDFNPTDTPAPPIRARDLWSTTVIVSPIDQVVHNPAPRPIYTYPSTERPRVYGLFPRTHSSTHPQTTSWFVSFAQALDEIADSTLALFNPSFYSIDTTHWSPSEVWKRTPPTRTWSSGRPITPDDPPNDTTSETDQ